MIEKDHPYYFLANLFGEKEIIFTFSKYVYKPDSLLDHRELISVSSDDLTVQWVNNQIESLRPEQELALHSNVIINKRTYHIPMIDFSHVKDLSREVIARLNNFVPRNIVSNMELYDSGRSYHAYSLSLISPKDWIEFMGRLLLVNMPNESPIIDARWIGHRLIGGYSSLRWSSNTPHYLSSPKKFQFPI